MRIKMLAITVAIASAKLLAAPIPGYVSDGLIAQWDGIDNAATGAHDASVTAWTDLVGGRQFVFTGAVDIGKDNIVFPGVSTAYGTLNEEDSTATFKKAGADGGTIEVFFKADDASAKAAVFQAPGGITVAHYVDGSANQPFSAARRVFPCSTGPGAPIHTPGCPSPIRIRIPSPPTVIWSTVLRSKRQPSLAT